MADSPAVQFFYDKAGWSYNPATETPEEGRLRGARLLASAEQWAKHSGVTFRWEDDWSVGSHVEFFGPGSAYEDGEPDSCESVLMLAEDGEVLGSLGCVDGADDDYRRVVEAEVALEAMPDPVLSPEHAV